MTVPVPGDLDVWIRVHLAPRRFGALSRAFRSPRATLRSLVAPSPPGRTRSTRSTRTLRPTRRRALTAVAIAAVAVLGGGGAAYAGTHKTIAVDVDGVVTQVSTFAGSVHGVLADRGVTIGARDTVVPAAASAVGDGSEIVVRHAKRVHVQIDGADTVVWTTALSAGEAISTLATRGGDVRLVASRSASGGRAELPVDLTREGSVDVRVDGTTRSADGSRGLAGVLEQLGITLSARDLVSVERPASAPVTVVVSRVVVQDVPETQPIPFSSTDQPDPRRYEGQRKVLTAGADGQRTVVNRITTIDGVESARELVSDTVTIEPVGSVVAVGTSPRPAAAAPSAPAGVSADGLNWAALAACESGGRADAVSASGSYYGLYQFSVGTWRAVGGSGLPSQASAAEQTARAQALYARSGAGQWPHCGSHLFG